MPRGQQPPLTDVRRGPSGVWVAECECGLRLPVPDEATGWTWLVEHPCTRRAAPAEGRG